MEQDTSFMGFPNTGKAPSLSEFVDQVSRPKGPPPVGATPEQVRAHYSGTGAYPGHQANQGTSAPVNGLPTTAVELPRAHTDMRTGQRYTGVGVTSAEHQNSAPPSFSSEDTGVAVELPSKFVFYDFKELYVHPFRGKHLAKLARASKEKNARLLAEVMSSVLSVPGKNIPGIAFQLTLPDWYWLLYFQRRSCYTKVSFTHKWRCRNPKHIQECLEGQKDPETLVQQSLIDTSVLEVRDFQPFEIPESIADLQVHCPTQGDVVLSVEDPRFGNDPEYEWTAQLACLIYPGLPWNERLAAVDNLEAHQIEALKDYEDRVLDFGVTEKANVTCRGCGASTETKLSVDASSFLPSAGS